MHHVVVLVVPGGAAVGVGEAPVGVHVRVVDLSSGGVRDLVGQQVGGGAVVVVHAEDKVRHDIDDQVAVEETYSCR